MPDNVRVPQLACMETLELLRQLHGNSSFGKLHHLPGLATG